MDISTNSCPAVFFYCSLIKNFRKGSWLVSTAIQLNSHGDVVVP